MSDLMIGKQGVDPLTKGPDAAQELFKRFAEEAGKGFTHDDCVTAAANIIMNALRQSNKKHKDADEAVTRLMENVRRTMGEHYNSAGERRSIFPFHQIISVPFIKFMNRFPGA